LSSRFESGQGKKEERMDIEDPKVFEKERGSPYLEMMDQIEIEHPLAMEFEGERGRGWKGIRLFIGMKKNHEQ
jgi:hypothetical protein